MAVSKFTTGSSYGFNKPPELSTEALDYAIRAKDMGNARFRNTQQANFDPREGQRNLDSGYGVAGVFKPSGGAYTDPSGRTMVAKSSRYGSGRSAEERQASIDNLRKDNDNRAVAFNNKAAKAERLNWIYDDPEAFTASMETRAREEYRKVVLKNDPEYNGGKGPQLTDGKFAPEIEKQFKEKYSDEIIQQMAEVEQNRLYKDGLVKAGFATKDKNGNLLVKMPEDATAVNVINPGMNKEFPEGAIAIYRVPLTGLKNDTRRGTFNYETGDVLDSADRMSTPIIISLKAVDGIDLSDVNPNSAIAMEFKGRGGPSADDPTKALIVNHDGMSRVKIKGYSPDANHMAHNVNFTGNSTNALHQAAGRSIAKAQGFAMRRHLVDELGLSNTQAGAMMRFQNSMERMYNVAATMGVSEEQIAQMQPQMLQQAAITALGSRRFSRRETESFMKAVSTPGVMSLVLNGGPEMDFTQTVAQNGNPNGAKVDGADVAGVGNLPAAMRDAVLAAGGTLRRHSGNRYAEILAQANAVPNVNVGQGQGVAGRDGSEGGRT